MAPHSPDSLGGDQHRPSDKGDPQMVLASSLPGGSCAREDWAGASLPSWAFRGTEGADGSIERGVGTGDNPSEGSVGEKETGALHPASGPYAQKGGGREARQGDLPPAGGYRSQGAPEHPPSKGYTLPGTTEIVLFPLRGEIMPAEGEGWRETA